VLEVEGEWDSSFGSVYGSVYGSEQRGTAMHDGLGTKHGTAAAEHRQLAAHPDDAMHKHELQRCKDTGEAYSAAYLITREHLLLQHTAYNLSWVNCEMGSFIFMKRSDPNKDINGSVVQSIDILDFSVVHLSTYERLLKRWRMAIKSRDAETGNIEPVMKAAEFLKKRALTNRANPPAHEALNRTVVCSM
jgi:hypothetical protein